MPSHNRQCDFLPILIVVLDLNFLKLHCVRPPPVPPIIESFARFFHQRSLLWIVGSKYIPSYPRKICQVSTEKSTWRTVVKKIKKSETLFTFRAQFDSLRKLVAGMVIRVNSLDTLRGGVLLIECSRLLHPRCTHVQDHLSYIQGIDVQLIACTRITYAPSFFASFSNYRPFSRKRFTLAKNFICVSPCFI